MTDKKKLTPSLLEPQSQGGDTAESGFDFQTNMILCKTPLWLSMEGFDSVIREATADFEAKFFSPSEGTYREALEAKNHHMTPSEFWAEIDRFMQMDQGSPGTFCRFTICCSGISEEIKPLIIGLRRVRDPQSFYDANSKVIENSYVDYVRRVEQLGKERKIADFLYEKVLIESFWNLNNNDATARGIFITEIQSHLPQYQDLTNRELSNVYQALLDLLKSNKARPIRRLQIEEVIQNSIGEKIQTTGHPVIISTEHEELSKREKSLQFEWASFFGGVMRNYPDSEKWNNIHMQQLRQTATWIKENRSSHRILLKGNRRISSAIALGCVFSAVSGFVVSMDYRGDIWSTDDHYDSQTSGYSFESQYVPGTGTRLIVTIGIMKDNLTSEVDRFTVEQGIDLSPRLNLFSSQPIISAKHANFVVNEIKNLIASAVRESEAEHIDLFYAGPTHLALFFGHRSNTLPQIQCFEWVGVNNYVRTCLL